MTAMPGTRQAGIVSFPKRSLHCDPMELLVPAPICQGCDKHATAPAPDSPVQAKRLGRHKCDRLDPLSFLHLLCQPASSHRRQDPVEVDRTCSENPPKTRAQKPNKTGICPEQKEAARGSTKNPALQNPQGGTNEESAATVEREAFR
jgi:hypothetical protein